MTDSNSGTVCACGKPKDNSIHVRTAAEAFVLGDSYMPEGWPPDRRHVFEPAPDEQPRRELVYHLGQYVPMGPVAASLAEGPRRDNTEEDLMFAVLEAIDPGFEESGRPMPITTLQWYRLRKVIHPLAAQPSPDAAKVGELWQQWCIETGYSHGSATSVAVAFGAWLLRRYFPPDANSESEVMPIPDNTNVCKGSSANLKTPGLAWEATARNVAIFGSKSGGWPCQVCGYGHEVGTDCPSGEATEGPYRQAAKMIDEVIDTASLDEIRIALRNLSANLKQREPFAPAAPEGAATPESLEDQWAARYLTQIRNAIFATIPEDQKSANSGDDALVAWPGKLAAQLRTARDALAKAALPLEAILLAVDWELSPEVMTTVKEGVEAIRTALSSPQSSPVSQEVADHNKYGPMRPRSSGKGEGPKC